jgi:acyl-CoA synthetase (AMP-forming)/AMP-acid ligase II
MILGDASAATAATAGADGGATLDALLADLAQRWPDALALADPPNRPAFTDGAPRRLSFAEADRIVTVIASRLHHMELPAAAVVGIQLPNIIENVLAVLGVLRAGMIAAPLPLLWRHADMVAALKQVGAKALITCSRSGRFAPAQLAMAVAAEVFSIRYLCGFGATLPDGIVAFDDLLDAALDPPMRTRDGNRAARQVATITFDMGPSGVVPVGRSHAELCAGARAVSREARPSGDGNIISTLAPASFAGICLTLVLWLQRGGTLSLHHPFDRRTLASQLRASPSCGAVILPGPVAFELAAAGAFNTDAPACVLAWWRVAAKLADSATWRVPHVALVDIATFGEVGMEAARRNEDGRASRSPSGPMTAPRDAARPAPTTG